MDIDVYQSIDDPNILSYALEREDDSEAYITLLVHHAQTYATANPPLRAFLRNTANLHLQVLLRKMIHYRSPPAWRHRLGWIVLPAVITVITAVVIHRRKQIFFFFYLFFFYSVFDAGSVVLRLYFIIICFFFSQSKLIRIE
jgi:hypothetical protein